ncbi:LTXXQ motif family protein [Paraburkholderia sp. BL6669N2]|uniref:Spy/CpxP family protein refolding chaperone n=1 Tax=unclassified Paraburkholderia TaxID=2615204 RepID=UPI000E228E6B|nr:MULTISPECIES: Spy/CpxP family protein refolding chaperone [unclassified Paraburkholderia]REE19183.1 LTXXQ motif family protein [Paraburkholderia sp. BL27I4N3]REG58286.1 LTXXQ motif family protein [Paraburkholderia sp. BL6669N2]TDY26849.1 LTXXQ motif family protein [Paraburkholderia sp. BL6665CI2N2]
MKKALVMLATAVAMSGAFAQTSAPASASAPVSAASAPAGKAGHERNVEDRIAYLHSQLKITSAQESQWNAFADVMRGNGQTMGQLFQQRRAATNLSALDDMKQYATIAQAHADGMKKLVDAFDPLYNSFSPEQKKLADVTFHQPGGVEGHGHRGKGKGGKAAAAPASDATVKP